MSYSIFDSHAHYTSQAFDADRHELLQSLPAQGVVGVVECATHYDTCLAAIELAHRYPWIWAAVGIHPESLIEEDAATHTRFHGDWAAELEAIRPLLQDPKVVAVGECGLDHHWPIPHHEQLALFEAQLQLAVELDKPIIVHDREAHAEVYALLKQYRPKGVVHCYSGSPEDAAWISQQGMYIGFGGAATFKGAKRAVRCIQALPLESIVLETDCPFMAPVPFRGQRCHSGMIASTGEFIAQIKESSPEKVFTATTENARRLFLSNQSL